ncbi:MAG: C40 family peptidase, partial [Gemmatimonadota bacterium]
PVAPLFGRARADGVGAWSADADMVASGARMGLRFGRLEPSLFVGVGAHGLRRVDGSTATVPAWSYGADLALPIASWLSLDGEARYRMPHESREDRLPVGVTGGWEIRTGLSLRFGTPARGRVAASPAPDPAARSGALSSAEAAALALQTADRYVGTPYRWGGDTPDEGFDCSGFVRWVFARTGVWLPRVSSDQARAGTRVQPLQDQFREGDLLFFAGGDGVIDHVAIYAGAGQIIHASSSRGAVAYDRLDGARGRWYRDHVVAVRRVIR